MFTLIGKAYVSGVIFGVSKKVTALLNRNMFTPEQNEFAEKTVGKLYSCRPVGSVFSEDGVQKLHHSSVIFISHDFSEQLCQKNLILRFFESIGLIFGKYHPTLGVLQF